MIKILLGGSPCTFWSIAQKNNRETEAEGLGWELFKNYLIAKEKFKPDFFLYENNKSASQLIKDQISRELGVDLMYINSALVSAQTRQRFYAFNWEVEQPKDKGILLKDILESNNFVRLPNYATTDKSRPITAHYPNNFGGWYNRINDPRPFKQQIDIIAEPISAKGAGYCVKNGLITIKGEQYPIKLKDGFYNIRKLSVKECCRLQTLPDDYCRVVSNAQAYKGLGNGWTAEVIIHILNRALKNIPKDEEIIVLSMYDGIGTGRYCLDKMGFTNVKYYAYEIDKYAKQIAMSNYPDIIQMGDAFDLRHPDWTIGY